MPQCLAKTESRRKASNHFWDGAWMFLSPVSGIGSGIARQVGISNALFESFAINPTNTIKFFYAEKRQTTNRMTVGSGIFFSPLEFFYTQRPLLGYKVSASTKRIYRCLQKKK